MLTPDGDPAAPDHARRQHPPTPEYLGVRADIEWFLTDTIPNGTTRSLLLDRLDRSVVGCVREGQRFERNRLRKSIVDVFASP